MTQTKNMLRFLLCALLLCAAQAGADPSTIGGPGLKPAAPTPPVACTAACGS